MPITAVSTTAAKTVGRHLLDGAVGHGLGGGDDTVEAAVVGHAALDGGVHGGGVGHVEGDPGRPPAELGGHRGHAAGVAGADDHRVAALDQLAGGGQADAGGAADDQDDAGTGRGGRHASRLGRDRGGSAHPPAEAGAVRLGG